MNRKLLHVSLLGLAALALSACGERRDDAAAEPSAVATVAQADPTSAPPVGTGTPAGEVCGGLPQTKCTNTAQFCEEPVGQCKTTVDGQGTCTTKPEICPQNYDPVCGCDGKDYGNACEARREGVSVAAAGKCGAPKDT